MYKIIVENLTEVTPEIIKTLNSLLRQLNSSAEPITDKIVHEVLSSSMNRLFVAKESNSNAIVGMLTLVTYRIPFAKKGIIEDLVVDKKWRKKGIGRKLITSVINQARNDKIQYLDLTSNPKREEANNLYPRIGFEKRDTNVYRIKL
ncbi:MAG: GNAT family N-acetyltransferase [Patescibacteria group bacterium]|nr:GNAT family N-acetyltransferase [Patescibacteria group bacterium]